MNIKVKLLLPEAIVPTRATPGAAGLDLYAAEDQRINPGEYATIETGVAIALPAGHVGLVWPRSGWAAKHGIDTLAGVVDCDYRGGIGVVLVNHGANDFYVNVGDRIAQLVIQRYEHATLMVADELGETHRDVRGFGSTG
jgi:dUTP pyrophosphatase